MLQRLSLVIIIFSIFFSGSVHAKNVWQLKKQEEGVQVFVSNKPNSALKVFKGTVTIPAKLSTLVAILSDINAMPKLIHDCKSASVIKEVGDTVSTIHLVTKMPWPVRNRDSVVHSVLTQDKKTKKILIKMQSKPNEAPLNQGMVRVQSMSGYWEFMPVIVDGKNSGNIKVTYELSLDPGGNLPKWLVNALSVDFPFYTLKNLRQLAQLPVYREAKQSYIMN